MHPHTAKHFIHHQWVAGQTGENGVTGHMVPWNYPMQIFGRSVGGALAAGNACVVKPSEVACLGSAVSQAPAGGFYQAPTLVRDVPLTHRLAQQEVFGPVIAAMPFDDEAAAVRMANATDYGLVASVWTREKGFEALYGFTLLKTISIKHD